MKRFCIFAIVGLVAIIFAASAKAQELRLKFAVISDVRADVLDEALGFIQSQNVDFIVLPGDFYYDGQDYYPYFIKHGFGVSPEEQPDQQQLYIAIGNHDNPPSGESVFQNIIAPNYPDNGPAFSPEGTIFSFDRGNCHFVITNPYWNYPDGGYTQEQMDWIEQDLSASTQAFKFVVGHEPAFPVERHVGDSLDIDPLMRDAFWKILTDNGVQAFFCGHSHHLSHILCKGVYQFDAGEVRKNHLYVTIVEVDDEKALVRSYETIADSLIALDDAGDTDDTVYQAVVLKESENNSDKIEILNEGSSPGSKGGCFISTLSL
jgi:3',5'-cyclic AMP phosphodiesterase CpdA